MSGTRGKPKGIYLTNKVLETLSQHEVETYVGMLSLEGYDEGPEWDRIYRWLEKKGHL